MFKGADISVIIYSQNPRIFELNICPNMAEVYRKNIDDDTVYAIWHITESAGELYA